MKKLNYLLLTASAIVLGVVPVVKANGWLASSRSQNNVALVSSPRYLEANHELLRAPSSSENSFVLPRRNQLAGFAGNLALANSPRFREEHPELRIISSGQQPIAQNITERDQLSRLTENKALAASPRFRENHPELLRSGPVFEIAPMK